MQPSQLARITVSKTLQATVVLRSASARPSQLARNVAARVQGNALEAILKGLQTTVWTFLAKISILKSLQTL
eukprot:17027-Karenia_brevis.AAC.1